MTLEQISEICARIHERQMNVTIDLFAAFAFALDRCGALQKSEVVKELESILPQLDSLDGHESSRVAFERLIHDLSGATRSSPSWLVGVIDGGKREIEDEPE